MSCSQIVNLVLCKSSHYQVNKPKSFILQNIVKLKYEKGLKLVQVANRASLLCSYSMYIRWSLDSSDTVADGERGKTLVPVSELKP